MLQRLAQGGVDLVTFTSSSTARNFKAMLPEADAGSLMARTAVAAIGPITADTAAGLGFDVRVVADVYTIPGLVEAIRRHFDRNRRD